MHFVKEKFLYFDPNSLNFFPEGQTDDKSSLVHQLRLGAERVTSHCLNQGWPTSMILIYNTRPQLVNTLNLCTLSPDHGMFWHLLRHFFQASQLFEGCLLGICWHLTGTANKTKSLINKSSLLRNEYWMPSCAASNRVHSSYQWFNTRLWYLRWLPQSCTEPLTWRPFYPWLFSVFWLPQTVVAHMCITHDILLYLPCIYPLSPFHTIQHIKNYIKVSQKSGLSVLFFQFSSNFEQSMAISVSCSVQSFKVIEQEKQMLCKKYLWTEMDFLHLNETLYCILHHVWVMHICVKGPQGPH